MVLDIKKFDPTKYYYWQVEAIQNGVILGVSETWEFLFAKQMNVINLNEYLILTDAINQKYRFNGDTCYLELNNRYSPTVLNYSIIDGDGRESPKKTIALKAGLNRMKLSINNMGTSDPRFITLFYHDKKTKIVLNRYEN